MGRAEVAHVRVERLGAGDRQDHGTHGDERDEGVLHDEQHGVVRASSPRRIAGSRDDLGTPSTASTANHSDHHGPEEPADPVCPEALDDEQDRDDGRPERDDEVGQRGLATARPSIADMTEMAGVMTLSP